MKNFLFQIGSDAAQYYKGILMRANPELHAETLSELQSYIPENARIIDLGAGQGAFSLRLKDSGYDVLSVDIDPTDFKADEIAFEKVDFNNSLELNAFMAKYADSFDVAIGMEVIEHVENPWEYVRLLSSLIKPGGALVITTPNIESSLSKLKFLFTGRHLHFDEEDLQGSGHINPITIFELRNICDKNGLRIVHHKILCRLPKFVISKRIFTLAISTLNLLFGWAFGKSRNGDILLVIAKKYSGPK